MTGYLPFRITLVLDKISRLQMAGRDVDRIPEATIHFGNLNFVLNNKEEISRAPEARTLHPRSLTL
jgi:hypothetical protein